MKKDHFYVSVVIPTYNRNEQLNKCLESFSKQTLPKNSFEVIVVNDGILNKKLEINADLIDSVNLRVYYKEHSGPASARNYGVKLAKGELIAFTDDDCIAKDNWIESIADKYEKDKNCVIGGRTLNSIKNNIYSETSQIINDIVYNHFNQDKDNASFVASNNFALSKELFHKLDGFDISYKTSSSEDRDFCNRLINMGYKIKFETDAIVYHANELNFKSFFLQHFNYGRGAYLFQTKQKQRRSGSLFKDMSFHLNFGNYIYYPFTRVGYSKFLPLAFLLLTWQLANVLGFLCEFFLSNLKSLR